MHLLITMSDLQHHDLSFDCKNLEKSTKEVLGLLKPKWDNKTIIVKHFTEGKCNVMIGCLQEHDTEEDDMVLIRVFGANTDVIVDRQAEKDAMLFLWQQEFSPPVYCTFNNGIVYGYVKGSTLDQETVRDDNVRCLIAKKMALLHSLRKSATPSGGPSSKLPSKLKSYMSLLPDSFSNQETQEVFLSEIGSKLTLDEECSILLQHLNTLTCDVVLCHNDLLLNNIVFDRGQNTVGFIDYEFAFYNYQAFDIGNHFAEYGGMEATVDYNKYPDKEYQLSWIRVYLEEYNKLTGRQTPRDEEVEIMYQEARICTMACHFFWGLCALYSAEHSLVDFEWINYAVTRLKEYHQLKKEIFG